MADMAWMFFAICGNGLLSIYKSGVPNAVYFAILFDWRFAVGAGLISGIFSVNETKDIITTASKIHGVSAAIGFMTLLFLPLLNGIISFKQTNAVWGLVDIIAFVLSLIFFICFIMGDKEQFKNTILGYKGLWERLSLFFMYVLFTHIAIERLSA